MENNEIEKKEEQKFTDDELIEDVDPNDDAPIQIIYRCKKCGQILDASAKDCWKCSSKEIERVVEEDTKKLRKVMLSARMDKLEHDFKQVKKNNDFLYILVIVLAVVAVVSFFINR